MPTDALVLAFDGVVADTLAIRRDALMASANAEQWMLSPLRAATLLPGRTLQECLLLLVTEISDGLANEMASAPANDMVKHVPQVVVYDLNVDYTLVDLVALRAERMVAERMRQGVIMREGAQAMILARQAAGTRLVLRSDGSRRDVEPALAQLGLELAFTFVRCADDLPRVAGASSLESSYVAIAHRLDQLRVSTERSAQEASAYAADVARFHLGSATNAG